MKYSNQNVQTALQTPLTFKVHTEQVRFPRSPPAKQAMDGLNKELRREEDHQQTLLLPSLIEISHFEQDFVPGSKRGAAEVAKGIAES